jgi:hypothetical protein
MLIDQFSVPKIALVNAITIFRDLWVDFQEYWKSYLSAFVLYLTDLSSLQHKVRMYSEMGLAPEEEINNFVTLLLYLLMIVSTSLLLEVIMKSSVMG